MKSKKLLLDFSISENKRKWKWLPSLNKSHIVTSSSESVWLSPFWEISWLFLTVRFTFFNIKKLFRINSKIHDSLEEVYQERINELEHAIRFHRFNVGEIQSMSVDRDLWKVLRD